MARLIEVRVPDMGSFSNVAVIDVLVKPGESIEKEASLVTLETEKATMDVPSDVSGVIEKIHVQKGGTVSAGDVVATVRAEEGNGAGSGASADEGGASGEGGGAGSGASAQGGEAGSGAAGGGGVASSGAAGSAAELSQNANASRAASGASSSSGSSGASGASSTPRSSSESRTSQSGSSAPTSASIGATVPNRGATSGSASEAASSSSAPRANDSGSGSSAPTSASSNAAATNRGATSGSSSEAASSSGAPRANDSGSGSSAPTSASSNASAPTRGAVSGGGAEAAASSASAPNLSVIPGGRTDLPPINEPGFSRAHAGPSVRKFARELGVDLTRITGTGFKGRITHDDVKAFVKKALSGGAAGAGAPATARGGSGLPQLPVVDFSKFGPIETKPLSRIQKISGPRLQASWVNIPHVTQFDEADITDLEDVRTKLKGKAAKEGIKLTPLAFIVRAICKALQEFPTFNASLDPSGENLILKKYMHIGFAADTPNGLMVPVIHNADKKDVYEIARALAELSEKARNGKLQVTEMQGGCFSISSLGGIGGTAFTPIINPPEVAILGVSRSSMKPFYQDGSFVPRLFLPLSLSYDHRVIDGAMAARFTTYLAGVLADPRQLTEAVP